MVFSVANWCFPRSPEDFGLFFPWNTPENGKVIFPARSAGNAARRTPQGQSDIQRDSFPPRQGPWPLWRSLFKRFERGGGERVPLSERGILKEVR